MSFDLRLHLDHVISLGVSIPLEQGNVFRQKIYTTAPAGYGLNPFGTGQCLST